MMHCGLLGQKLSHSYSPAIHSLLGDYEYKLYETEPENVEAFLQKGDFDALNVTIPYKKRAAALCDELSETARAIGSVNTFTALKSCCAARCFRRAQRRCSCSAAAARPPRWCTR